MVLFCIESWHCHVQFTMKYTHTKKWFCVVLNFTVLHFNLFWKEHKSGVFHQHTSNHNMTSGK